MEMLIVVAIIAILLSMLLPGLQKAREAAKTAVCLSNLKQISTAQIQYIGRNNQHFTPSSLAGKNNHVSYDDLLSEYLEIKMTMAQKRGTLRWSSSPKILKTFKDYFTCPNDTIDPGAKWGDDFQRRSYSFNGAKGSGRVGLGYNGWSRVVSSVTDPSNTIMFLEQHHSSNIVTRGNHCYAKSLTRWQLEQESNPHGPLKFCWALVDGTAKIMSPHETGGTSSNWGMWKADQD